jgi:choline dehydrogenase-like flavoprotein
MSQVFDYVIVGGGTAGCVLAARLSEDRERSVCLIEAGGDGRHRYVDVPGGVSLVQRRPELNWRFLTVPQAGLNGRRIGNPRGRGLGGSALINGMVYFRGNRRDFDDWAALGASGWDYAHVLPYFRRTEHNENLAGSPWHGSTGEMNVRTVTHPNPLNRAFLDALAAEGVARSADLNGAESEGAALRQLSVRDGRRETSARALLRPALSRPNLTVLTGLQATRVLLEGKRAVGVEALGATGKVTVRAQLEVLLTAGALQSPQLLLLSGIGDPAQLSPLGIAVQHALPGVGANLHDHLASPVHQVMRNTTSYGLSWPAAPRNLWQLAQYLLTRTGPLANNIFESAAFIKSDPSLDRPDLQLVFQPARRPSPKFPFPLGHGFAVSPVGLYPHSRGRLTLASADPLAAPHIDPNLLADPRDLQPLLYGMRLVRRLFASPAFAGYGATESAPGAAVVSDEQLADYVRAEAYTVHHPVGTCRMGSDAAAVVDPQLRVQGIEGLRVADASVFPRIVGGNTNAVVVMVAEKAADLVRGRAAPAPEYPALDLARPST